MTASYLTHEDVQNYGNELLDVSQRAALHALAPHLQALENSNADLQRRLAREARHNLDQQVERAVPNYREIDRDPRWHRWLTGIDVYTGTSRQALLNIAIQDGSAARVVALFNGFMQEAGDIQQPPTQRGQAPGRRSSGKPIYSRDQIKQLYRAHQQGAYTGRDAEWARQEVDIIAAGREGRILGGTDVAGK
jgi:hypothetical protein